MGKASREKRERRAMQSATLAELHTRVESRRGTDWQWGSSSDGPDISRSLGELITPYAAHGMPESARNTLVRAAVLAWNRTVTPGGISSEEITRHIRSESPEALQAALKIINEMSQRKLQKFPNDRRTIVDAELREQNNGTFYLAVTLLEDIETDEDEGDQGDEGAEGTEDEAD